MHVVIWLSVALAQVEPWTSYPKLVSANGRGVIVMNGANDGGVVLDTFSDRLYQQEHAEAPPVQDLLYDSYFAVDGAWLRASEGEAYEPGTGLVRVTRASGELELTEVDFAPMGLSWPGYVQLLRVENHGTEARTLRVNSLHNHHLGNPVQGANVGSEALWLGDDALLERGQDTRLGMAVVPLRGEFRVGCDQVFGTPGAFDGNCGTEASPWTGDDRVGGFEWALTVAPGEVAWVGTLALFFVEDADPALAEARAWLGGRAPEELVPAERAWWEAWHAPTPSSLTPEEAEVYAQALAFLKMGQVTEPTDAFGQIPASLPAAAPVGDFQHLWNITWVRDQAYAVRALTVAGHLEEAEAALAFTLQGKAGDYADYVGRDYGLSVCRLYGDGSEWSDDDGTGPNIELDNFGLTLWAIGTWVSAGGDLAFVEEHDVFDDVADVLVDSVADNGLLVADSSIWERHWNGNQKQFTYSTVWAARGLREAAWMAEALGDERATLYAATADRLQGGVCEELVGPDGLLGNADEEQAWDLAAVDAFNNGTLDAADPIALRTYASWREHLAVESGHGFKRNDDGDLYDEQEWVMVDLRLAEALRRGCRVEEAEALESWITAQARANHLIIAELMHPETAAYAGPAPMMGFGSGLYVLTLHNRAVADADCADGVVQVCEHQPQESGLHSGDSGDRGEAPPEDRGDEGCGCGSGPAAGWLALLLAAVAGRRR